MSAAAEVQRLAGLRAANAIRTRRAELKAELKSGRVSLSEVLNRPPSWTKTMRVADLLRATPGLGTVRVNRALRLNQIRPSRTMEHFPAARRQVLLAWLSEHCPSASIFPKGAGK